jgi:hypothetical protein
VCNYTGQKTNNWNANLSSDREQGQIHAYFPTGRRKPFTGFRVSIATQLLGSVQMPNYTIRGRLSSSSTPLRLQAQTWAHFPMHVPPTEKKKKKCYKKMCCKGKRSESSWQCKKCGVALHLPDCFEIYHIQTSY